MLAVECLDDGVDGKREYYDIKGYVDYLMKPFKLHAKEKQINLKVLNRIVPPALSLYAIYIDVLKINLILRNFVGNAIKFTKAKGSVVITIKILKSNSLK